MTLLAPDEAAVRVCSVHDLVPERGSAALVGDQQVALFLLRDGVVRAVSNLDPYSGAHVISRGIVGSRGDAPTIASPMHKQVFDLRSGECLDAQGGPVRHLSVWRVRRDGDDVLLLPPSTRHAEAAT